MLKQKHVKPNEVQKTCGCVQWHAVYSRHTYRKVWATLKTRWKASQAKNIKLTRNGLPPQAIAVVTSGVLGAPLHLKSRLDGQASPQAVPHGQQQDFLQNGCPDHSA